MESRKHTGWLSMGLLVTSLILGGISYTQEGKDQPDTEKMFRLTISADKTEYLPLQQVVITAKLKNIRSESIRKMFLLQWRGDIKIYLGQKDDDFNFIEEDERFDKTYNPFGSPAPLSGTEYVELKNGEEIIKQFRLLYPVVTWGKYVTDGPQYGDVAFSKPGTYKIIFVYVYDGPNKKVKSNIIDVSVKEPTETDKKAYAYLNEIFKDKEFLIEFLTAKIDYEERVRIENRNGKIKKLEEFLASYSKSNYASYVQYVLGKYYFYTGDEQNEIKAAEILKKAIEGNQRFEFTDDALYHIGQCYYNLKNLDEAEKWLKRLEKESLKTDSNQEHIRDLKENIERKKAESK